MRLTVLPGVAKSFVMFCTKCNGDKFHTVITHISSDSAKVVCDICKKKSTFKLGMDVPPKKTVKNSGSSLVKAKNSAIQAEHEGIYNKLLEELSAKPSVPYSIRNEFSLHTKIEHSKFGLGVVTRVLDDRVEVIFPDEVRFLVHRRL
jgi:hypothetical protein